METLDWNLIIVAAITSLFSALGVGIPAVFAVIVSNRKTREQVNGTLSKLLAAKDVESAKALTASTAHASVAATLAEKDAQKQREGTAAQIERQAALAGGRREGDAT